jgi:hypothetical protein
MSFFSELSCPLKQDGGAPEFGGVHLTSMLSFAVAVLSLVEPAHPSRKIEETRLSAHSEFWSSSSGDYSVHPRLQGASFSNIAI